MICGHFISLNGNFEFITKLWKHPQVV